MKKIPVGILGATGMVGQTLVQLLDNHPWFEVTELAASERSSGKSYEEAMHGRWNISTEMPVYARRLRLKECLPRLDCKFVFSALDSSVASEIEENFARAGYGVSSNAKNHRMDADVPLLIPEINSNHIGLIKTQQKLRKWKGFLVTDPNCSTIEMSIALKPIIDMFGVEKVAVTTMQALSGAGYPGISSMDIIDNVLPYIKDEEEKMESEPLKIFGTARNGRVDEAKFRISAQCNRVAVRHGHTEAISVALSKEASEGEILSAWKDFSPLKSLKLPTAPEHPIIYHAEHDRPQPKLDANLENGMAVSVGRLRKCNVLDYKFTVLGHNLVRGAAGAALLNAELLRSKGYI